MDSHSFYSLHDSVRVLKARDRLDEAIQTLHVHNGDKKSLPKFLKDLQRQAFPQTRKSTVKDAWSKLTSLFGKGF